jgi:hypothetical protein
MRTVSGGGLRHSGERGFLGTDWQAAIAEETGNCVFTPKRATQLLQNAPELDRLLGALREHIEGFSPTPKHGS